MKTRIATAISVIGVLTAGTAAAMVNTQIFESDPTVAGESSAMLAPQPTTVDLSLAPSSTSSTIAALTTEGSLTEYTVGDAGVVTVDVIDGELRIVSAAAFDGWVLVDQEEKLDEDRVEVYFSNGSLTVEFDADYVNGQIIPDIDAEQTTVAPGAAPASGSSPATTAPTATTAPAAPAPTQATAPTTYRDDDDDHDDDHDDDDRDDEDDHDDDHEEHEEDHDDD